MELSSERARIKTGWTFFHVIDRLENVVEELGIRGG
nr:MAG TPA: hypothetical protein [Caudoviricetes sp.]